MEDLIMRLYKIELSIGDQIQTTYCATRGDSLDAGNLVFAWIQNTMPGEKISVKTITYLDPILVHGEPIPSAESISDVKPYQT